jgi:hypothetical protein
MMSLKGPLRRPISICSPKLGPESARGWALLLNTSWVGQLADSEDAESWLAFLSELEAQGLRGELGLECSSMMVAVACAPP